MALLDSSNPKRSFFSNIPYYWVALALATIMQTGDSWVSVGISTLYPFIKVDLALSQAQVGLITSSFLIGGVLTVLPGGWLTDVWGVRKPVAGALVFIAIAGLGISTVHSLVPFLVLAFLVGVGTGPVYPATSRAVMDWLPPRRRGMAMGIKQTGPPITGAIAAATLPLIATAYGWRLGPVFMAAMVGLVVVVTLTLYKDKPSTSTKATRMSWRGFAELVSDKAILVVVLWATVFVGFQFVVYTFFILFLVDHVGLSPVAAGGYMGLTQICTIVGRITWGTISDTLFKGRRIIVLGILGMSGGGIMLAMRFVEPGIPGPLIALIAIVLGLTMLSWMGMYTVVVSELAGAERTGTALGAAQLLMRVGMSVMPPLFGLLIDVTGGYSLPLTLVAGLAFVVTAGLLLFGSDPKREPQPQA
ncbi:MAG: Nitrate/nitrite transporter NarK [Chloroflexi bacterium]|jgi:MFS family permease|nr:MAG: Nitrate/nitrite transporter NarK [Chloroflexota bacterium]